MAKMFNEDRHQYNEKTKVFRASIDAILKQELTILSLIHKDPSGSGYRRLGLAEDMLDLASNYMVLNGISLSMLNLKNDDALNDGRKSIYKSIIYMEELVTNYVDAAFSEYESKLRELESVDAARRYALMRKMGLAIQLLENAYGDNSRWKWTFVELEGRFATVAKNIFDLKAAVVNTDPRSPHYAPTVYHLRMIKKLLMQAADRYRNKYELSTNRIDDFKQSINFLCALRRVHILLGERDEAEIVGKKLDIWSTKLEADSRKHEE
ncbi:MAG: hypothetical protein LBT93_06400 [Treponema sp.]|jgi:hypothetical protein|nr:hypothetical protein [Treponema sp.]